MLFMACGKTKQKKHVAKYGAGQCHAVGGCSLDLSSCAAGLDQSCQRILTHVGFHRNSKADKLSFGSRVPEQQCRHAEGCRFESVKEKRSA